MLNPDGTEDFNFNEWWGGVETDFSSQNDRANSVIFQSDGKVVVGGFATSNNYFGGGDTKFALVRYTKNGDLDSSFGTGGKVMTNFSSLSDAANSITLQSNGKIIAAGVTNIGDFADYALARYNADGSLDATFGTGGKATTNFLGFYDGARAAALQPDGKIILAGSSWNGSDYDLSLARYQR